MARIIGGTIEFSVNGTRELAKGNFTYNIGRPMREGKTGADEPHGYTEKPQIPRIEGAITDRPDLDLAAFLAITDATVIVKAANGKGCVLYEAWNASSGDVTTEEGEIACKFEGMRAEEF